MDQRFFFPGDDIVTQFADQAEHLAAFLAVPSAEGSFPPEVFRDGKETLQPQDSHRPNYTTAASTDSCAGNMVLSKTGQCLAHVHSIADSFTA